MIYNSILDTIGRTPVVQINRLAPAGVTMYVKCEFFNPASVGEGSPRHRHHRGRREERRAEARPDRGRGHFGQHRHRTGHGLRGQGLSFVSLMVETFSVERRKIMRMLGAKVILTPAAERGTGMVRKAEELAKKHGWFLARQFENQANPAYHRNTTGPEILSDFASKRLDAFVSGWGTGGTITGAGEMIKLARPETKIVLAEPENAALVSGKPFAPHKIQGWTPDFVPKVLNTEGRRSHRAGERCRCHRHRAPAGARRKASSAAFPPAPPSRRRCTVAREAAPGSVILAMLPDTGERYLSTALAEGINEGSDS